MYRMDEVKGLSAGNYKPSLHERYAALSQPYTQFRVTPRAVLEQSIIVPDISFWQDKNTTAQGVDFAKMKANGAKGVIIRGGQNAWVDEDFDRNWMEAKMVGLPRGTYWFLDPRKKPQDQADLWATKLGDKPELDLWADYEAPDAWGGAYRGYDGLYNFLERMKQNVPSAKLTIYTGYYYWLAHSPSTTASLNYFKQFPLCLAWYTTNPAYVKIPRPWTELLWWQWTSSGNGTAYGVESLEIDLNYFNGSGGTLQDYNTYFGLGGVTPPPDPEPDPGGNMDYYEVRSTNSLEYRSIRSGPRITFPSVATIPVGGVAKARVDDVVTYTQDTYDGTILRAKAGDQWVHIFEVNGQAREGWSAVKHLGVTYTNLRLVSPPESEYIIHVRDGVMRRFVEEQ